MRTNIILFVLLSILISENEKQAIDADMTKIMAKKKAMQMFIIPTEFENHPEWKALKKNHDLEIRQLRKKYNHTYRKELKKKFREVKKRHKEDEYRLYQKLNK